MSGLRNTLVAAAVLLCGIASLASADRVSVGMRYWAFADRNDLRAPYAHWVGERLHVGLEAWQPVSGGDLRVRPEAGVMWRDVESHTAYHLDWRHEQPFERFTLGAERVLGRGWVAKAEVATLANADSSQFVYRGGFDRYWGSYHFWSAEVVRDPRDGGLWAFPVRVRLATESNDWVQATVVKASQRTTGWALDARWRLLRVGVERNNRFDFTNRDNVIWSAGLEFPASLR